MQGNGIMDYKKLRAKRARDLAENLYIERKLKYRNDVMEGKIERGMPGARKKALAEWALKKGIPQTAPAICPKCNLPMKAELAEKQRVNNREGGVSCIPCIMGRPRRV